MDRLVCGREEDLVSYLYGELDEAEALGFCGHLKDCKTCSVELESFGSIRESVIGWRNESLPQLASLAPAQTDFAVVEHRRSASAALRQFFNLSPIWMKAAVGFASLLFCIFAVLAVSGLRRPAQTVVSTQRNEPSAEEINSLVNKRVQDELNRFNVSQIAPTTNPDEPPVSRVSSHRRKNPPSRASEKNARRPLTRVEREQLAADLRLVAGTNDFELELLDDEINQ